MSKKPAKGEYIETDTGNKVSRKCQIIGTTNIILGGKTVIQAEVIIRGDLLRSVPSSSSSINPSPNDKQQSAVAVAIGRYCFFSRGCALRPPGRSTKGVFSHYPLKISDHVFVGPGSVIEAAILGSHVHIGAGVVVGKFAIIKDYVKVLDGAIIPANMVIPSFSIVGGRPARIVGEIAEGEVDGFDLRDLWRSIGNN
ncbi:dynactin [Calycina marina]|uniref:Dynactin subunit 5 n=1 Tax=Calycina marina TaxID=1763456 RepID=A0A9P7Z1P5_9HELO|nr:dynactin [Calycina marina]